MRDRRWRVVLAVTLLISAGLVVVSLVGGDALAPSAPSSTGPTYWAAFTPGLSAYDPADGYDLFLLAYGSTWTYAHGDWSNITATAGKPVGMVENSRLTYDARDGYLLLFGGATSTMANGVSFERPNSNTWAFQGGRWTNLTDSVTGAPPPMTLGVMTYDSENKAVVLFGGSLATGLFSGQATNETWTYSDGVWTNATVPGPPTYGGSYAENPFLGFVDDRADGYLLYYSSFSRCAVVGGCAITWTYHGGTWTNRTATFAPSPRLLFYDAFTYDSTTGTVIAQADCVSTPNATCEHHFGTFVFSGGNWKDVTPATGPSAREVTGSVDDPTDGGVLIVGGCCWVDFSGLSLGWQDYWVYSHGNWTEFEPWGGNAPSWTQNDGSWAGLAIAVAAAVGIAVAPRKRNPREA